MRENKQDNCVLSNQNVAAIPLLRKSLIFISSIFIFGNYYYFYFFDFWQGISAAPQYYSFLKLIGISFFVFSVFELKVRGRFSPAEISVISFFVIASSIYLVKSVFLDDGSSLYLNPIFCLLPFALFRIRQFDGSVLFFFEASLWVGTLQIILDSYFYYSGNSLWDNNAFIGGLGNPSSFGIFCNILIAYLLFVRRGWFISSVLFFLLVFGVVNTKSLFALAALILVVSYYLWSKSRILFAFLSICLVALLSAFWHRLLGGHIAYKLESLHNLLFKNADGGSQSVSLRVEIHEHFLQEITNDFFSVSFYGYGDSFYYHVDSQFLSFFGSFGIFLSMLFFFSVLGRLAFHRRVDNISKFFWISLALFFAMFFTNRILDYYPMPLIFFTLFFALGEYHRSRDGFTPRESYSLNSNSYSHVLV